MKSFFPFLRSTVAGLRPNASSVFQISFFNSLLNRFTPCLDVLWRVYESSCQFLVTTVSRSSVPNCRWPPTPGQKLVEYSSENKLVPASVLNALSRLGRSTGTSNSFRKSRNSSGVEGANNAKMSSSKGFTRLWVQRSLSRRSTSPSKCKLLYAGNLYSMTKKARLPTRFHLTTVPCAPMTSRAISVTESFVNE